MKKLMLALAAIAVMGGSSLALVGQTGATTETAAGCVPCDPSQCGPCDVTDCDPSQCGPSVSQ